jgi:iron complex transport system permease protein
LRGRRTAAIIFLALAGGAVILLATGIGAASVSPGEVLRVFGEALGFLEPGSSSTSYTIIWKIRLPRVLLGFLIGASLAAAGAAFQGLLQNPLADPYTLGVSSGAALGAMLGILFLPGSGFSWQLAVPLCGFLGALLALFIVYQLGRVGGRLPVTTVLLAGVVVSSFFSALISLTMILAGQQLRSVFFWIAGGLGMRGWKYVLPVLPYFGAGLLVLLYFSRDLNLILLGEEAALSMGVEVERVKRAVLVTASLVTAGAVSVSGMIGFVGLIVPHALRILVGPDHRFLLPFSALGGGIFLVLADTFARTVMAPVEIPVGVITAFVGAPFFLLLLRRHREKYRF